MDGKRLDIYQDVRSKSRGALRLSQLAHKTSSLSSKRQNLPLGEKNVNFNRLFGSKKIEHKGIEGKPLLSINQRSYVIAKQETGNVKPLGCILQKSKASTLSEKTDDFQKGYALRRRIRDNKDKKKKSNLVNQLIGTLNDFKLLVKTSQQQDQNYDILIEVRNTVWLSPFEIVVISDDARIKNAVLHSQTVIPKFVNLPSKLAICSKCCLKLYDDTNWYLKWKFL